MMPRLLAALLVCALVPATLPAQTITTGREVEVVAERVEVKRSSTVVGTAEVGDRFTVLRTFENWVRVRVNGREGWIDRGALRAIPRIDIGALVRPVGSVTMTAADGTDVALRSSDELVVVRVPVGDTLTVARGEDVGTVPANRVSRITRTGTDLEREHGERVKAFQAAVSGGNVALAAREATRVFGVKREVLERVLRERPSDRTLQNNIRNGIASFAEFASGRLRDLEELESELALRRLILTTRRVASGADHWQTASALAEYRYAKLLADSEPERLDELRAADREHGAADRLLRMQDYLAAANRLSANLADRRRLLGDDHLQVAVTLNNLAFAHDRLNQHEKAAPLYRESAAIVEKVLGRDHPERATRLGNLGQLHADEGRFDEAEPLLLECLSIRERSFGEKNGATQGVMRSLVAMYERAGEEEKARALRSRLEEG